MLLEAVPDRSAHHGLSSGSALSTRRATSLKSGNLRGEVDRHSTVSDSEKREKALLLPLQEGWDGGWRDRAGGRMGSQPGLCRRPRGS